MVCKKDLGKIKKIEFVFENCECLEFDAEGIFIDFKLNSSMTLYERQSFGIKDVIIQISKKKVCKTYGPDTDSETNPWWKRFKVHDLTHIYIDGVEYYIEEWHKDSEWVNRYEKLEEFDDRIVVTINKKNYRKN